MLHFIDTMYDTYAASQADKATTLKDESRLKVKEDLQTTSLRFLKKHHSYNGCDKRVIGWYQLR
jgi:hypothetical protein